MTNDLLEALPMPILLIGEDGRIAVSNAGARKLFGDTIRGRHHITVLRQPEVLDAIETARTSSGKARARFLTSEARTDVTLEAFCSALPSGEVLIAFEDRTPLERAIQQRRDFVANVSHELRTPLTALLGFIETLRGAAKDDTEAREKFLGIMAQEAGRMNRLVSDLLSLGRVEADERVRPTALVDLSEVVSSVLGTLRPLADDFKVSVETSGLEEKTMLPGDADQLRQVSTNLIENAIKYSGRDRTVRVSLQRDEENKMLRAAAWVLRVADTGPGFDPVLIPRLTERFYRIDNHRSREMGGTGLGLAIVKHIINRHRGRLRIESTPGKGSCFTVILPTEVG